AQPPPARRRGGRPALAPVDPAAGPRAGPAAGPERRHVPLADDPRPGVLRVLARRHVLITGDTEFEREVGLELLVATARLWRSLGHHDSSGEFRIDGVTGPDEYTAIVDNNVYTNLMAQLNLRYAAEVAGRHSRAAARLGVNAEEMASWRDAAKSMRIPFDEVLGVHPQS